MRFQRNETYHQDDLVCLLKHERQLNKQLDGLRDEGRSKEGELGLSFVEQ